MRSAPFLLAALALGSCNAEQRLERGDPTFLCKSYQSYAKTGLSGLFTEGLSFYGDNGVVTTDLATLKWKPNAETRYVFGFAEANTKGGEYFRPPAGYDPQRRHTLHPAVVAALGLVNTNVKARAEDLPAEARVNPDGETFRAYAVGNLDDDAELDVWYVERPYKLVNVTDDCASATYR